MTKFAKLGLTLAAGCLIAAPVHAMTKVSAVCMYESGQNGTQKVSDYTIWNTSSDVMPKGVTVFFQTTGAPGKTFSVKTSDVVAPQDTFATGGNYPPGTCTAWWMK